MKSEGRVLVRPTSGISPEQSRDARARAWTYVFQSFYRRNGKETVEPAPEPDTRDEAKE
jgi:hypothetical protein